MTFSDGCGFINDELSKVINEEYEVTQCSAYQVRIAGCKGVLVFNPDLKPN